MTLTQEPATEGQIRQITRVAEDAARKAVEAFDFDKEGAQRVHGSGDELATAISNVVATTLTNLSVTNQFADEEVSSTYGYLSGYQPKPIAEQVTCLRELFPDLGSVNVRIAEGTLPSHAEGWFAIPKWQSIASTYGEAVQKVLDQIKETRNGKFYNYREGDLGPDRLRQSAKTEAVLEKVTEEQGDNDILVIPAQFGLRHRGRSVRRACEVMQSNEFGLGAFAIGIMLFTHPKRLEHYDNLWIDCAGDEYDFPDAGVRFGFAPCFGFGDDEVEFGTSGYGSASRRYGSVSGFVPQ